MNPDPIGAASVCGSGLDPTLLTQKYSLPDQGSGAFLSLPPGSGEGFFRISDPGSQTHICDSLMTTFGVKSTIILSVLATKKFLYLFKNIMIFVASINGRTAKIVSLSFLGAVVGSEIRDPGSGMDKIRDKHPGSATLQKSVQFLKFFFKLSILGNYIHISLEKL